MTQNINLWDKVRTNMDNTPVGIYYNTQLIPSLEAFNRADTVNMSNNEMNKFRHVAGTKQAINDLGWRGLGYTFGKELYDITRDGWKDTKEDLMNDLRAIKLYMKQPQLEEQELYKRVYNDYIKPYRKEN